MSAAQVGDSEVRVVEEARGYETNGVGVGDPWLDDRYMMWLQRETDFTTFPGNSRGYLFA